jgi:hypothetical protein
MVLLSSVSDSVVDFSRILRLGLRLRLRVDCRCDLSKLEHDQPLESRVMISGTFRGDLVIVGTCV